MEKPELNKQIQDLLDGTLSEEARTELFEKMESDYELRTLYLDFVHLNLALTSSTHPAPSIVTEVIQMDRVVARQKRRALKIAALSSIAAILIVSVISFFILLPSPPIALFKAAPETEFVLTHSPVDGEVDPEGNVLAVGSRIKLMEGTLELNLSSGVRGIIQAPADISVTRADQLYLHDGIAWFEVPTKAIGFEVDTKEFLVTDLGTEFGINVDGVAEPAVHVFRGSVKVTDHRAAGVAFILKAKEARKAVLETHWRSMTADLSGFLTSLPTALPSAPPTFGSPYLHWSFDDHGAGPLAVSGTHRALKRIETTYSVADSAPPIVAGRVGKALQMDGSAGFVGTNWHGIVGDDARSIAFWFRLPEGASSPAMSELIVWGASEVEPGSTNEKWEILAGQNGNDTYLRLHASRPIFIGTTPISGGEWHHLAIVYNGKVDADGRSQVSFYVDGVHDDTTYDYASAGLPPGGRAPHGIDTDTHPASSDPVTIGAAHDLARFGDQDKFKGEIDELYIFDGILTDEELRKLANP